MARENTTTTEDHQAAAAGAEKTREASLQVVVIREETEKMLEDHVPDHKTEGDEVKIQIQGLILGCLPDSVMVDHDVLHLVQTAGKKIPVQLNLNVSIQRRICSLV